MRKWTVLSFVFGLGLLFWLLKKTDLSGLGNQMIEIGWAGLIVLPISVCYMVPNTLGWSYAFIRRTEIPFWTLFFARIKGEAVNYALPSGYLGGEPLKAALLSRWVSVGESTASVVVAKTTQTLALLTYILLGLLISSFLFPIPDAVRPAAIGVPLLLGFGVIVLAKGSSSGLLGKLSRWANKKGSEKPWLIKLIAKVDEIDGSLKQFYKENKSGLFKSTLWHFVGWFVGAIEIFIIAKLLGFSTTLLDAFLLDALATMILTGGFFIPASLGAFEAGHYIGAMAVGLPPEFGITLSILRRFRLIFWVVLGLILISFQKDKLKKPEPR